MSTVTDELLREARKAEVDGIEQLVVAIADGRIEAAEITDRAKQLDLTIKEVSQLVDDYRATVKASEQIRKAQELDDEREALESECNEQQQAREAFYRKFQEELKERDKKIDGLAAEIHELADDSTRLKNAANETLSHTPNIRRGVARIDALRNKLMLLQEIDGLEAEITELRRQSKVWGAYARAVYPPAGSPIEGRPSKLTGEEKELAAEHKSRADEQIEQLVAKVNDLKSLLAEAEELAA